MLLPALGKAKEKAKAIGCISNNKQLVLGWILYAGDYDERCANNFTIPGTEYAITSGRFDNWVNNLMTWSADNSLRARSVTNIAWGEERCFGTLHRWRRRHLQMSRRSLPQLCTKGEGLEAASPKHLNERFLWPL